MIMRVFEQYLIEKGETELLYNGLSRISTKYGTLESAFNTLYGNTWAEHLKLLSRDFLEGKVAHVLFNILYGHIFNMELLNSF